MSLDQLHTLQFVPCCNLLKIEARFPLAVDPLIKGRYVDDIIGGSHTIEPLIEIAQEVK